jgi:predicted secreted protein
MSWLSIFAIYFILWWVVLFAMLPFGLKTQEEDGEVTLGTVPSAPKGAHMLGAVIRTTLVSGVIFAVFYVAVVYFGFSFNDIPRIDQTPRDPDVA